MKLPNLERALVPEAKVTKYLLSLTHPDGRFKAAFFLAFGFSASSLEVMAFALRKHANDHEVERVIPWSDGMYSTALSALDCPDGRRSFRWRRLDS